MTAPQPSPFSPDSRLRLAAETVLDLAVMVERLNRTAADTAIVVKARELLAAIETRGTR